MKKLLMIIAIATTALSCSKSDPEPDYAFNLLGNYKSEVYVATGTSTQQPASGTISITRSGISAAVVDINYQFFANRTAPITGSLTSITITPNAQGGYDFSDKANKVGQSGDGRSVVLSVAGGSVRGRL